MAFWQMSTLSSRVGAMLIAAVSNDKHLVISGDIHDEHVADAASGAQARFAGDDRSQQFVSVQAAFHQQFCLALANQCHRLRRRCMAVRRIDDFRLAEIDPAALAISSILAAGPTRIGVISPFARPQWPRPVPFPRRDAPPQLEPDSARRIAVEDFRTFLFQCYSCGLHSSSPGTRTAGPVSFSANVSTIARPTPYKRG